VEVQLHAFLTSTLDGDEWSASHLAVLPPRKELPAWKGGWVVPRVGLDAMAKRKIPNTCRETNHVHPPCNLVAISTEISRIFSNEGFWNILCSTNILVLLKLFLWDKNDNSSRKWNVCLHIKHFGAVFIFRSQQFPHLCAFSFASINFYYQEFLQNLTESIAHKIYDYLAELKKNITSGDFCYRTGR
jgi:hypothetical protein